jgi:hypothetical protein
LLAHDPIVSDTLATSPHASIVKPMFPPTIGAVFLALRAAGVSLSEDVRKNIETSLKAASKSWRNLLEIT